MYKASQLKRQDVLKEVKHLANNYLGSQGPLDGLRKELRKETIDLSYMREKARLIKLAGESLEHDLEIIAREQAEEQDKTPEGGP